MSTARKPAITRTTSHPADALPDRPTVPNTGPHHRRRRHYKSRRPLPGERPNG